jgi:hypothetical protein
VPHSAIGRVARPAVALTPHRIAQGVENLFERLERMATYSPVFCDITWGAGGSTADVTLDIAKRMQNSVRQSLARGTQDVASCGSDLLHPPDPPRARPRSASRP